jgi:hypothetical protein
VQFDCGRLGLFAGRERIIDTNLIRAFSVNECVYKAIMTLYAVSDHQIAPFYYVPETEKK